MTGRGFQRTGRGFQIFGVIWVIFGWTLFALDIGFHHFALLPLNLVAVAGGAVSWFAGRGIARNGREIERLSR